jgi:hypothetical protein
VEGERRAVRLRDGRADGDITLIGRGDDLAEDVTADSTAAVGGEQRDVDHPTLVSRPGDPHATHGPPAEQDQLVLGGGEGRLPGEPLSAKLELEELVAGGVLPRGDVRSGRRVQVAQERFVVRAGQAPLDL